MPLIHGEGEDVDVATAHSSSSSMEVDFDQEDATVPLAQQQQQQLRSPLDSFPVVSLPSLLCVCARARACSSHPILWGWRFFSFLQAGPAWFHSPVRGQAC